ncbi:MAG: DUF1109 family protein [Myxococcales bacterium]|nr:DUF1109 family protein [Myxococcales bacterium]
MTPLPPDIRSHVLATSQATPSLTRHALGRRRQLVLATALGATLAVGLMRGVPEPSNLRPMMFLGVAVGAALLVAVAVSLWMFVPAPSALGRPSSSRRAVAVCVPILLAAGMLAANLLAPETLRSPPAPIGAAVACLIVFTVLGMMLLGGLVWLERDSDPTSPRATGASLAALAGAWTAFAMAVQCPAVDPVHVLGTHVLPSALLIGAGVLLGGRFVAMRAPHRPNRPKGST